MHTENVAKGGGGGGLPLNAAMVYGENIRGSLLQMLK